MMREKANELRKEALKLWDRDSSQFLLKMREALAEFAAEEKPTTQDKFGQLECLIDLLDYYKHDQPQNWVVEVIKYSEPYLELHDQVLKEDKSVLNGTQFLDWQHVRNLNELGEAYSLINPPDWDKVLKYSKQGLEFLDKHWTPLDADELHRVKAGAFRLAGKVTYNKGKLDKARENYRLAIQALNKVAEKQIDGYDAYTDDNKAFACTYAGYAATYDKSTLEHRLLTLAHQVFVDKDSVQDDDKEMEGSNFLTFQKIFNAINALSDKRQLSEQLGDDFIIFTQCLLSNYNNDQNDEENFPFFPNTSLKKALNDAAFRDKFAKDFASFQDKHNVFKENTKFWKEHNSLYAAIAGSRELPVAMANQLTELAAEQKADKEKIEKLQREKAKLEERLARLEVLQVATSKKRLHEDDKHEDDKYKNSCFKRLRNRFFSNAAVAQAVVADAKAVLSSKPAIPAPANPSPP
jgi:hypothetical protein